MKKLKANPEMLAKLNMTKREFDSQAESTKQATANKVLSPEADRLWPKPDYNNLNGTLIIKAVEVSEQPTLLAYYAFKLIKCLEDRFSIVRNTRYHG